MKDHSVTIAEWPGGALEDDRCDRSIAFATPPHRSESDGHDGDGIQEG